MIFKGVVFLSLLLVAYTHSDGRGATGTDAPADPTCVQVPPTTTHWTGWYSTSNNFPYGSTEDFKYLCANIVETQCREKYTDRSLNDTGMQMCRDDVLRCWTCENVEVRLLCNNTNDTLPEPDLHWSLSELDSGATMGAIEDWTCNEKIVRVYPIAGTMVGEVVGGERLRQSYGPKSHSDLCAVRTNGDAYLAFKPFVENCLTSPDCCDSAHGISVMFWLHKNEMDGTESRSQSSPRHVFRSPSLVATVQNGQLIVTYLHWDTRWTVNQTLVDREWVHVSITFDPLTNLTVYFNSEMKGQGIPAKTSISFSNFLEEFQRDNTSFWVFPREGDVTSSEIRPIMMTELKVFYSALSADLVHRIFQSEREDGPPKVLRMAISQKTFSDSVTQEDVHHIKLTCLIRTQQGSDLNVRFMYEDIDGHFEELTSSAFFMTSYLHEENAYRTTAVLYIFGRRERNVESLPSRFTCEVVSDSRLSAYGYPVIETSESTNLDDTDSYYWTGFFNANTPDDGNEIETKDEHLAMAEQEGSNSLCQNPIYAECRRAPGSGSQLWYEISPPFVPDYNYPCDGNGIRCSSDGDEHLQPDSQDCPDLQVRYACRVTNAPVSNSTSMSGIGSRSSNESEKIDTSHGTNSGNNNIGPHITRPPTDTNSSGVWDSTSTSRGGIDIPTTTRSSSSHDVTTGPVGSVGSPSESTTSPVSKRSSPPPNTSTTPDVSIAPDTEISITVEQVQDSSTPNNVSSTPDVPISTRPYTRSKPGESSSPDVEDTPKATTVILSDTSIVPSTVETSVDATVSSIPITAPPQGGKDSGKSRGSNKTITGNSNTLTYLYPVMIVVLGVGIPTITACYYLCRKLTPGEIEEQRLIADRKQKLADQQQETGP